MNELCDRSDNIGTFECRVLAVILFLRGACEPKFGWIFGKIPGLHRVHYVLFSRITSFMKENKGSNVWSSHQFMFSLCQKCRNQKCQMCKTIKQGAKVRLTGKFKSAKWATVVFYVVQPNVISWEWLSCLVTGEAKRQRAKAAAPFTPQWW